MRTSNRNPEQPIYLRVGDWNPSYEFSTNYAKGSLEAGLSVYALDENGCPVIPTESEWAADDLRERLKSSAPKYLVQGDLAGEGHDGEPLLVNVIIVGMFLPGA